MLDAVPLGWLVPSAHVAHAAESTAVHPMAGSALPALGTSVSARAYTLAAALPASFVRHRRALFEHAPSPVSLLNRIKFVISVPFRPPSH